MVLVVVLSFACRTLYGADWPQFRYPDRDSKSPETRLLICADGMLYCYDENTGHVALVKAAPKGFVPISTFQITVGRDKFWAHPSLANGRLYLRHGEYLMAYDIQAR